MPTWQPDLVQLASRIARLGDLLKVASEALHADLGVTASMRGVMAQLAGGPRTVPDLARQRSVSRQHVQTVVNDLLAAGLALTHLNPSHRRSQLIGLTDAGRARLKQALERETQLLAHTAPAVSSADVAAAMRLFDLLERDLVATAGLPRPDGRTATSAQGAADD